MEPSNFWKILVIPLVLVATGCFGGSVIGAEFGTLSECLSSIERNSGHSLRIVRDTPDIVSGNLSNGKTFACEIKRSGTKGTYYEGWYIVD